jgi:uncharacterized protein YhbP (UPF0306 family)
MTQGGTELEVQQRVLDYLRQHQKLTLATASQTGIPRATTLMYVNDGVTFYVWTHPESTIARHVSQNPYVSFAVDDYSPNWRETKGIQANGECTVVLGKDEIERAVALFEEKFPSLSGSAGNVSFFRIVPTDVRFIEGAGGGDGRDQSLGLQYRLEVAYSVFRDLPPAQVAAVASSLQTVEVEPGQVIVRQGTPADKFFIIVDGRVVVIRESEGREQVMATLGRGDLFGEIAILRGTPRTATVRAVERTTLLAMERDTFRSLVAQSLGTTQEFDELVRQRLERLAPGRR